MINGTLRPGSRGGLHLIIGDGDIGSMPTTSGPSSSTAMWSR